MQPVSRILKEVDYISTFIPIGSSLSNVVAIFFKTVVFPCLSEQTITNNHYYSHIRQRTFTDCFILLIPVFGNIVYHSSSRPKLADSISSNEYEQVIQEFKVNIQKFNQSIDKLRPIFLEDPQKLIELYHSLDLECFKDIFDFIFFSDKDIAIAIIQKQPHLMAFLSEEILQDADIIAAFNQLPLEIKEHIREFFNARRSMLEGDIVEHVSVFEDHREDDVSDVLSEVSFSSFEGEDAEHDF